MYNLSPTGTALVNVADLFPDPTARRELPDAVLDGPEQRLGVGPAMERQRAAHVRPQAFCSRWHIPAVRAATSTSDTTSISRGKAPLHRRSVCRIRSSRRRFSRRPISATATSTACRSASDKRFSQGLFFTGSYQLSKNMDNNSGEIEANDTAFAWNPEADWALSRYDRTHRSSVSFGYELPWGDGKPWLSERERAPTTCSATGKCLARSGCRAAFHSRSRSVRCNRLAASCRREPNFAPGREGTGRARRPQLMLSRTPD